MNNIVLKIEESIEEYKKQLIAFQEIALALKAGRSCLNCGTDISERRSDAKYCSHKCRHAYNRAKQEEKQGIEEAPKRGAYENVGRKKRSGMSRAEYLEKYKQVVKELKAGYSLRRAGKLCGVSKSTAAKVSKTMREEEERKQAELLKADGGKIEKLLSLIKEAQDLQFSSQKAKAAKAKATQLLEQVKSFFK